MKERDRCKMCSTHHTWPMETQIKDRWEAQDTRRRGSAQLADRTQVTHKANAHQDRACRSASAVYHMGR